MGLFGDDNFWCPTELDPDNQPFNWGRCGENCPRSGIHKSASKLKGYFPNLLETQLELHQFLVFKVRDFKYWLLAYFLIF